MPKTNLLSTVRFLSLATAALVTGPVATYAAMDPPAPKLDGSAADNAGKAWCLQNEATGDDKVYQSA
jgi:hypothetical protein